MSVLRRTWVVPLAVAAALTLLPTPATSDEPSGDEPLIQDPGSPIDVPGSGCRVETRQVHQTYCPSGWAQFLYCYGLPIAAWCV
jgi:hypothetical protein